MWIRLHNVQCLTGETETHIIGGRRKLMIPSRWVSKDERTGKIVCGSAYGIANVFPHLITSGVFTFGGKRFAATAELALEKGWKDMAEAWRDEHACPKDCPMNLCSSRDCPKVASVKLEPG